MVIQDDIKKAGKKLELKKGLRKSDYVKEKDPNYLPEGWEDDLIEAVFRFPECEGANYKATPLGYSLNLNDGDTVMVPRKVAKYINDNCKIYKRDRDQRDPSQPSRWMKSKTRFTRRCYFETTEKL